MAQENEELLHNNYYDDKQMTNNMGQLSCQVDTIYPVEGERERDEGREGGQVASWQLVIITVSGPSLCAIIFEFVIYLLDSDFI